MENLKSKIPKKGTKEFDIMMHLLQVIEGAITAFSVRAGVNIVTREAWIKEILTWSLGIILLFGSVFFSRSAASSHLKTMAFATILEALNRSLMKRLEKTQIGQKYLQGDDEIILSENEMQALLEKRIAEDKAMQGDEEEDETTMQGDEEEDETTMQGDEEEDETTMQGDDSETSVTQEYKIANI